MSTPRIGVVIHKSRRKELFSAGAIARIEELGDVVWTDSVDPISVEQACEILKDCEIGIGSWNTPHPCAELMEACLKLRLWEHAAGSVKPMFGPHLEGRDLTIGSCCTAIADDVAEFSLAEMVMGLRGVFPNADANRRGVSEAPRNARSLYDSTIVIGVVAASQVGLRVIELLKPFACQVVLYDPFVSPARAAQLGVTLVGDLLELCRISDVVSLHTPALPTTENIMGAAQFQAMKDDAVFINTARGMCVEEDALVAELGKGRLQAFLDVSDPEPTAEDGPFRTLPNVVYTSHIAGAGWRNIGDQVVEDVAAFLAGGSLRFPVTADMLDSIA